MANVPSGYTYYDKSAGKYIEAGSAMPAVGQGDQLYHGIGDNGLEIYTYYTSYTMNDGTVWTNGWYMWIRSGALARTSFPNPLSNINGKPVKKVDFENCVNMTASPTIPSTVVDMDWAYRGCESLASWPTLPAGLQSMYQTFYGCEAIPTSAANLTIPSTVKNMKSTFNRCSNLVTPPAIPNAVTNLSYCFVNCESLETPPTIPASATLLYQMFYGCTALTRAPEIPANVTSIGYMFYDCTSLEGNCVINATGIAYRSYAFEGTVETIILLGDGASDTIAKTSSAGNVYNGVKAQPKSFTAVRCDATGQELATGDYVLLTVEYTAPDVNGRLLPPTFTIDGVAASVTWHKDSWDGSAISAAGIALEDTGTIEVLLSLGSASTSASYAIIMNTTYSGYSFVSGVITASLTYKEFIIDINATGTGLCFGAEADENLNGVEFSANMKAQGRGLLDFVWPVGSMYMTTDADFNPNDEWGGTWTYLVGDAYIKAVNPAQGESTGYGGQSDHKIQIANLPAHTHGSSGAHTHTLASEWSSGSGSASAYTMSTSRTRTTKTVPSTGSAHEHNSVGNGDAYHPYYYGVYVWHRTA